MAEAKPSCTLEYPQELTETNTTCEETLVIIGGFENDGTSRVCWKLNSSKQFEEMCNIPFDELSTFHSVCKTPHGFVLTGGQGETLTGGEASDLCIMYNTKAKIWTKLPNMLKKRYGHGSICMKGVLYVIGGNLNPHEDPREETSSVQCLTIGAGKWEEGPEAPITLWYPLVANVSDTVYTLDIWRTQRLFQLNIVQREWRNRASFPVTGDCEGASMTVVKGQLYVVGADERLCAWYKPESDTWITGQQPSKVHFYGPLVCHDNILLVLGGSDSGGTDVVEEYSIEEGSWATSNIKMPKPLSCHYAFLLDIPLED